MKTRPFRRDVRDFLEDRAKTQRWLAKRLGISESTLSDILHERHRPSLALALELSALTGIPVERFAKSA